VKIRTFSFRVAFFNEMAALIKSGYRGYVYIMYEIAGKKTQELQTGSYSVHHCTRWA